MNKIQLLLDSKEKVKKFCDEASTVDFNFDLKCGGYITDGKSVMGILSLDLNRPVEILPRKDEDREVILEAFEDFIK